jgi:hypothetical protein
VVAKGQGTEGTLTSFHAYDGMGAPMKEVVDSLKAKGIEEVGVWMTLQGYWNSIDKNSPLVQKYDCRPYKTANRNQEIEWTNGFLRRKRPHSSGWTGSPR